MAFVPFLFGAGLVGAAIADSVATINHEGYWGEKAAARQHQMDLEMARAQNPAPAPTSAAESQTNDVLSEEQARQDRIRRQSALIKPRVLGGVDNTTSDSVTKPTLLGQ